MIGRRLEFSGVDLSKLTTYQTKKLYAVAKQEERYRKEMIYQHHEGMYSMTEEGARSWFATVLSVPTDLK